MVQVPLVKRFAVVPETVQTLVVSELKLTVRPELAVALSATVPPTVCVAIAPKVMVWLAWVTWKPWTTGVAAEYSALPLCEADGQIVP